jgi:hypothetical protein
MTWRDFDATEQCDIAPMDNVGILASQKACRNNDDTLSRGDIFSEVSKTGIFLQ